MKDSIESIKKFFKNNWKYLIGALAFIVLVIILVNLSEQQEQRQQKQVEEQQQQEEEKKQDDVKENEVVEPANSLSTQEYPEIEKLINRYFESMANNDVDTLKDILAEVSPEDEQAVKTGSEHTENYNNIICYTKAGMEENTYVVFVSYEAKFVGISTTAPGLLSFYVITKDDGSLCIQNKLDDKVKEYIQNLIVEDKEVADLFEASQKRYEQALSDDSALKDFVENLEKQNTQTADNKEATPTPTEQVADNKADVTPTEENTENKDNTDNKDNADKKNEEEQKPQESATTYVTAKENVNVRNDASESADAIGTFAGGETAEKLGEKDGWILINFKGQQGYVKADYVEATSDGSGSVSAETAKNDDSSSQESTSSESSSSSGTTVRVKEAANVRESMSADSKKLGTAFAGESYTKIMDYAEGWTKIEFNGGVGYIKTECLE